MALGATVRRFEVQLADADRGVYEALDLRVAQHPSETDRYLCARVLARCLEHADGVEFGKGVSTDDEPALWRKDLRGDLLAWIEVGAPSLERLHRASKRSPRVAVYGWKGLDALAAAAPGEVHRAEALELVDLGADLLDAAAAGLAKTQRWELSISGGAIYLVADGTLHEGTVRRIAVSAG
jgi:uncharacterized protein YaeQ